MMVYLDLENTVIDNLTDRNWLEDNCEKIKHFLKTKENGHNAIIIYTFGWKTRKEIDEEFVKKVHEKLGMDYLWMPLVKEDAINACIKRNKIPETEKEIALQPGMMVSKYGIDKTQAFHYLTKELREHGERYALIDDTTETNYEDFVNAYTINPTDL